MELSCVLKPQHAFWVGSCPLPAVLALGGGCLGPTVEQGQTDIPTPATTPRIPGGHPLPTSLWDTAWLAEESPRRAPMGAPMSCSPFHLHESPGDGVNHFCWHSTALQHWHPSLAWRPLYPSVM